MEKYEAKVSLLTVVVILGIASIASVFGAGMAVGVAVECRSQMDAATPTPKETP